MKRLIIVRHGKSSWEEKLPDDKRPLQDRGYRDAHLICDAYIKSQKKPAVIWSSHATRALETAKIFKEKLNIEDSNFFVKSSLYTFSRPDLNFQIETCSNEIDTLMVFGHNPAITGIVNNLGDEFFDNVPTTGLTIIDFETDTWNKLENGKTILHLFPKNLR